MTTTRMIRLYGRGLLYGGPLLLVAVLAADPRWTGQPLQVVVLVACCLALRGAQIPLSKYSYLTQTGLLALTGSLLVGLPATALAVAAGTFCADWVWQRKAVRSALINAGREVVALVAGFGTYAALVQALGLAGAGLSVELLLPLLAYAIAYFAFSRILFYFSLILRAKLERGERMFILRYECISYGATIIAAGTIVATVVNWPPVVQSGETGSLQGRTRDPRVADASLDVQSLVLVPLKFGDQVIGTLELEHHKRKTYRPKDLVAIATFANQLATAIHITELRRPLVETVERLTQQLATLARATEALREVAGAVAASTRAIREGVVSEEGEVSGGLEATETLAQVSRRVSEDGSEAAQASSMASEVASKNRQQIRDAIERLVALKGFVGESSAKVQALGQLSRRITGFIASIRELADMTNLLALNAAIEAARAGKHGKGFAVVAEEVRRLAEQSGSAAEEAGGLVQDIHREVGEVVEQMRRGQVTVGGVEDLSAAALEALDAIVAATAEATTHAKRIAEAAQEQDRAFGKLRRRIHAVAEIASRNRTEADDVATRASEAAQGLSDLERATRELEEVATMLRELTRGFASVA